MSEALPQTKPTLETTMLGDRTLMDWFIYLTSDAETGAPTGYLHTPGSRYGRNGNECAPYALAIEWIYEEANGPSDAPFESMDFAMGWVVNDSSDVEKLIKDYGYCLPACLREMIGGDDESND